MLRAAQSGDIESLQCLLTNGHSVNESNFDSVTALHEACLAGRLDCIQFLLEHGANVNARNIDGATPLCDACNSGNIECVRMLVNNGADVNPKLSFYTTPLHEAVTRDNQDIIDFLINCGADLEKDDLHFGRPLHVAAIGGFAGSAKLLLKGGALVNSAHSHQTALHMAAVNCDEALARLLIDFGANARAENRAGQRPSGVVPSHLPLHKFLHQCEESPPCLLQLCRQTIRKLLISEHASAVCKLELPLLLKKFLLYEY
jgi:ankyrin repeat/SOCS box protein 13